MAACSDSGQCSKKSIPVPAPVLTAVAGGVPGRCSSTLVLHKQAFHWLHRLERQIFEPLSPSPQGRSLPFLTVVFKIQIFFYFSSCQFPRGILHFYLWQQLNSSFLQPRCFLQHGTGSEQALRQQVTEPLCGVSAPVPALQCALLCALPLTSVYGDLPEPAPALSKTHTLLHLKERGTQARGERRRKGRHTAVIDHPCYGYRSIGPFPIKGKKCVF